MHAYGGDVDTGTADSVPVLSAVPVLSKESVSAEEDDKRSITHVAAKVIVAATVAPVAMAVASRLAPVAVAVPPVPPYTVAAAPVPPVAVAVAPVPVAVTVAPVTVAAAVARVSAALLQQRQHSWHRRRDSLSGHCIERNSSRLVGYPRIQGCLRSQWKIVQCLRNIVRQLPRGGGD